MSDPACPQADLSSFAHLHLHTQYSLLDGAIRVNELCDLVAKRGMKAVAITDHNNMFGAVHFYQSAKAAGIKPIFGSELAVAAGSADDASNRKVSHLVLLAKDEEGYKNLQRLVSFSHLRGLPDQARVDKAMLAAHAQGIIATSACMSGDLARLLLADQEAEARALALEYKEIFEPGAYYFEIQPNGRPEQERLNAALAKLGQALDIPLIAANNCHYVDREHAHAHEVLSCLGMGRSFDDPTRPRRNTAELYLKTPEEMWSYYQGRYPSAFVNACEVAKSCEVDLKLGSPELPDFEIPQGSAQNLEAYLELVVGQGLDERIQELRTLGLPCDEQVYRDRIKYELGIINSMKFPGYFLIVWDFIRHAKEIKVPVGPGRGSGAGSLVAYALRITDIDPMRYNLLFERFLNPERVSMPDFDIDFCMDRREEVIAYVTRRYGADRVGQIATFHSLKARGLVRDVCRVMGVMVAQADDLAKCIPEGPKVSLSMCMAEPKDIKAKMKAEPAKAGKLEAALGVAEAAYKLRLKAQQDEKIAEILQVGTKLEGLYRHAGMHAAGVVIGNRPLWEHVPCFSADGRIVTQYTMTDVELAGLVKFDFLGLKTLTVIQAAVDLIDQMREGQDPFDLNAIPIDDAGVFEMISRGDTTGVFQLESSGFKELLKKLKPDCFEDIIAAVALYRPGPLEGGMVDQFIECKHGRREIEYPHDLLQDILRETYGVFVYQEQVMQAGQLLAGFSLGAADVMRRAMGKKKQAEMDRQRTLFVEGCRATNDIPEEKSNEIFDLIDKFAGYGFNKSHSAAYGQITYQTAYLKHHFPSAFMAGLMTCDQDKIENVVKFVSEARDMGIEVLGPCINESRADFSLVDKPELKTPAIRFGMRAIRSVGEGAVDSIVAARSEGGPFTNLFDLCRRIDLKKANRRCLENLILGGALDAIALTHSRSVMMASVPNAIEQGQSSARDRASGQTGLFAAVATDSELYTETYVEAPKWSPKHTLAQEREVLGFYLSGHPLDRYRDDVAQSANGRIADLGPSLVQKEVTLGGVISGMRSVVTKTGKAMCFFQLEDQSGRIEVVVFPKTFARPIDPEAPEGSERFGDWLSTLGDAALLVTGKLEGDRDEDGAISRYKLLADRATTVVELRQRYAKALRMKLDVSVLNPGVIEQFQALIAKHPGQCPVRLQLQDQEQGWQMRIKGGPELKVSPDDEVLDGLDELFGSNVASFLVRAPKPEPSATSGRGQGSGQRRPSPKAS